MEATHTPNTITHTYSTHTHPHSEHIRVHSKRKSFEGTSFFTFCSSCRVHRCVVLVVYLAPPPPSSPPPLPSSSPPLPSLLLLPLYVRLKKEEKIFGLDWCACSFLISQNIMYMLETNLCPGYIFLITSVRGYLSIGTFILTRHTQTRHKFKKINSHSERTNEIYSFRFILFFFAKQKIYNNHKKTNTLNIRLKLKLPNS